MHSLARDSREDPASSEIMVYPGGWALSNQLYQNIKIYQFALVTMPDQLNQTCSNTEVAGLDN